MRYVFEKKILILVVAVFDLIGYLVFGIIRMFMPKDKKREPSRILVIRVDHIGDVILSTSVFRALRKRYTDATIDLITTSCCAELVDGNPYLNNIFEFDPPWFARKRMAGKTHLRSLISLTKLIKKGGYDAVIDLRGDLRHILAMFFSGVKIRISYGITGGGFLLTHSVAYDKGKHESYKNLDLLEPLGIISTDNVPEIFSGDKYREELDKIKEDEGILSNYAVIHAVPGHYSKRWSSTNFFEVTKYLRDSKKLLPVFIGTATDKTFVQEIIGLLDGGVVDLSGKTNLKGLAAIIKGASIFIGLDSGPAHIAATCGVPGIVLFSGVNNKEQWAPVGEDLTILSPGRNKGLSELSAQEVCGVIDKITGINVTGGNKI